MEGSTAPELKPPSQWAFRLALCLLSPLFFLTYFIGILAPLPLMYLHSGQEDRKQGLVWWGLGAFIGLILCFFIRGSGIASLYIALCLLPSITMMELMRKWSLEATVSAGTFLILAILALAGAFLYYQNPNLPQETLQWFSEQVKGVSQYLLQREGQDIPEATKAELEKLSADPKLFLQEAPGLGFSLILLVQILPFLFLLRWNPRHFQRRLGIQRDFFRKWTSPDWLVWPALLCGALHVFELEIWSTVARNAMKPILLIYFFHGMSILSFFLDSLRMRGGIRWALYGIGTLFLTPMIVSFGFFDLWFNFRSRQRSQPVKDEET